MKRESDGLTGQGAREWLPIESAPKDGTWVLAYGMAYPELVERNRWMTAKCDVPRVPHILLIKWIEGWYDEEIDMGNGTYRKEKKLSYAYWHPEPNAFHATHWMPLPNPPVGFRIPSSARPT